MEVIYNSISSTGSVLGWPKSSLDNRRASDSSNISFRCRNPLFGTEQFHWLPTGQDPCLSKVWVAADYSDSVPNSSNYAGSQGYHPLEELKVTGRNKNTKLTSAEIARNTVEANHSGLLVFPGAVHCEPHDHILWSEFQYIIDEAGDIYFEIHDDENILQDRGAINPVNVFIGMDIPKQVNRTVPHNRRKRPDSFLYEDINLYNIHFEALGLEVSDIPANWEPSKRTNLVHPLYFAKCLTKATNTNNKKKMDRPSNGLSIMGCLRPAHADEDTYIRDFFYNDCEEYLKGTFDREEEQIDDSIRSTLYKLEIMRIELFSVYGDQCLISLEDFLDAQTDMFVHCASMIIEHFNDKGIVCDAALRVLCRKKGFNVERAHLMGVDSLGVDVRAFSGTEARTLRFPFKVEATSVSAAEKKIQRMLFPQYRRRNIKKKSDGLCD